jgi:hypothetical protein
MSITYFVPVVKVCMVLVSNYFLPMIYTPKPRGMAGIPRGGALRLIGRGRRNIIAVDRSLEVL